MIFLHILSISCAESLPDLRSCSSLKNSPPQKSKVKKAKEHFSHGVSDLADRDGFSRDFEDFDGPSRAFFLRFFCFIYEKKGQFDAAILMVYPVYHMNFCVKKKPDRCGASQKSGCGQLRTARDWNNFSSIQRCPKKRSYSGIYSSSAVSGDYDWLVVQCAHREKYDKSMGRMTSHILWKIIQMFETTNQMNDYANPGLAAPCSP